MQVMDTSATNTFSRLLLVVGVFPILTIPECNESSCSMRNSINLVDSSDITHSTTIHTAVLNRIGLLTLLLLLILVNTSHMPQQHRTYCCSSTFGFCGLAQFLFSRN